jgi:hypothetical protein
VTAATNIVEHPGAAPAGVRNPKASKQAAQIQRDSPSVCTSRVKSERLHEVAKAVETVICEPPKQILASMCREYHSGSHSKQEKSEIHMSLPDWSTWQQSCSRGLQIIGRSCTELV